jgi:hypothetical protein
VADVGRGHTVLLVRIGPRGLHTACIIDRVEQMDKNYGPGGALDVLRVGLRVGVCDLDVDVRSCWLILLGFLVLGSCVSEAPMLVVASLITLPMVYDRVECALTNATWSPATSSERTAIRRSSVRTACFAVESTRPTCCLVHAAVLPTMLPSVAVWVVVVHDSAHTHVRLKYFMCGVAARRPETRPRDLDDEAAHDPQLALAIRYGLLVAGRQ